MGIRLVQEVGKHRKRIYSNMGLTEAEQWRRAFWSEPHWSATWISANDFCIVSHRVLVVLDRLMSASLGRPCAIQEEEYVLIA